MPQTPIPSSLPNIAALPLTTVRQIGSSQVLIDPSSVVKELIDNALDARANAIFVDITANTFDSIQVKDTGHGIPQEDRLLVCRRYCTSKIRDFSDLKAVGGKWLGFRGEALASMAEMSGAIEITTRVEGESVAVKMKYGRDGELVATERASAPVGTTVKVTDFFKHLPVRKQAASKQSAKWLAKIRRLMQAYALTRPAVRLSLRVLKAKSNKGDFVYAPKKDANVEDAVLKVFGKDCALQCDWTVADVDSFEIRAFLPKLDAIGTKIAHLGAFISVDGRPVSSSRGVLKQLITIFKERLRKANPKLSSVRELFFVMNVMCPPESYDPNIEPAKDDVLFEDGKTVIAAVEKMLVAFYPEATVDENEVHERFEEEPPTSVQRPLSVDEPSLAPSRSATPIQIEPENIRAHEVPPMPIEVEPANAGLYEVSMTPQTQPRWRSTMYGIDEEDLETFGGKQPPVVEEEEGCQDAIVSNPWTIARMCASFKNKASGGNMQLITPAKSRINGPSTVNSPEIMDKPSQTHMAKPLTPQNSPNHARSYTHGTDKIASTVDSATSPMWVEMPTPWRGSTSSILPNDFRLTHPHAPSGSIGNSLSSNNRRGIEHPFSSSPFRHSQQHEPRSKKHKAAGGDRANDNWFGRRMNGHNVFQRAHAGKGRSKIQHPNGQRHHSDFLSSEDTFPPTDYAKKTHLTSKNNTDIRDFFRKGRQRLRRSASEDSAVIQSFIPRSSSHQGCQKLVTNPRASRTQYAGRIIPSSHSMSRASSAEPRSITKPKVDRNYPNSESEIEEPSDIADQLRAYVERHAPKSSATSIDHPQVPPGGGTCDFGLPEKGLRTAPARRRTTDGLKRRKSSQLPLERIPLHCGTHNIILPLYTNIKTIIEMVTSLKSALNTPTSNDTANADTSHAFSTYPTNSTLDSWALKAAQLLNHLYEQENDVDVFVSLRDGIRKALAQGNPAAGGIAQIQSPCHELNKTHVSQKAGVDHIRAWTNDVFAATSNASDINPKNATSPLRTMSRPDSPKQPRTFPFLNPTEPSPSDDASDINAMKGKDSEVDFNEWLVPKHSPSSNCVAASSATLGREVDCVNKLADAFEDDEMLDI